MSSGVLRPSTLRALPEVRSLDGIFESNPTQKVTVGCLIAVAAMGGSAEAQEQTLPPVTVDAPIARPKPPIAKPSPEQIRARNSLRRIARERAAAAARAKAEAEAEAKKQLAQQDPYADPAAPYKANQLASPKFPEPIVNTPRSITVLTQEVLRDKDATSLKDALRTTPGITLGTGEGGNAFGDRFFIRGFDARNDVFVDGIRDPAVSVRENFFTEQIEILKGPAATIDGRGTAGGALNIVTKQATNLASFYNADTKFASDGTKRVTFDVNQVVTPTLAIRMDGMWQIANISERNFTTDDRWGGLAAIKWTPTNDFTVWANYIHTNLHGLPDFGVPYNNVAGAPVTSRFSSSNPAAFLGGGQLGVNYEFQSGLVRCLARRLSPWQRARSALPGTACLATARSVARGPTVRLRLARHPSAARRVLYARMVRPLSPAAFSCFKSATSSGARFIANHPSQPTLTRASCGDCHRDPLWKTRKTIMLPFPG